MSLAIEDRGLFGDGETRLEDIYSGIGPIVETTFKPPNYIRRLPDGWLRGHFATSDERTVVLMADEEKFFSGDLIVSVGDMAIRAEQN